MRKWWITNKQPDGSLFRGTKNTTHDVFVLEGGETRQTDCLAKKRGIIVAFSGGSILRCKTLSVIPLSSKLRGFCGG
jgi:hypothetical protein